MFDAGYHWTNLRVIRCWRSKPLDQREPELALETWSPKGSLAAYILGLEVSGLYLGSPLQNLLTNPQPRIHEEAGLEKSRVLGSDREENNSATSFCFIVFLIFHSLIDGGSLSVAKSGSKSGHNPVSIDAPHLASQWVKYMTMHVTAKEFLVCTMHVTTRIPDAKAQNHHRRSWNRRCSFWETAGHSSITCLPAWHHLFAQMLSEIQHFFGPNISIFSVCRIDRVLFRPDAP